MYKKEIHTKPDGTKYVKCIRTTMNCFIKYKSYTSSTSIPVILRDKEIV